MPNVNDLKSSKFLTKNDVEPDVLVTIKAYEQMNVALESQPAEMKWVLHFAELDKPLVLNSTNGQLIEAITGSGEFDDWIGAKVVLWNDKTVGFAGKITGGIRVRARRDKPPAIQKQPQVDSHEEGFETQVDDVASPPEDEIPY
jgi:hypothetical protein